MLRLIVFCAILLCVLNSCVFSPLLPAAQFNEASGVASSEHLLLRLPLERESLGRDSIGDLERCYRFMDGATGEKLPKKIYIFADWSREENSCIQQEAKITLGMNHAAAALNPAGFLTHAAACEIGRLGLLQTSGGAQREDNAFLFEGMIEILAHEFTHSSRNLEGSWVVSQLLDQMGKLGLAEQRSWSTFSGGKRSYRNAAPGVTFLSFLRESQGRDRPLKFFESLKNSSLVAGLAAAFRAPASELESAWLKRVREYKAPDEITTNGEEAPQLLQTTIVPETAQPGGSVEIRLFMKDAAGNLFPDGVFVKDERTGKLLQPQMITQKGLQFLAVVIPVEATCSPGNYGYRVTAVDESGNVRRWNGSYRVLGF
jgi:hypothetical protein